MRPQPVWWTTAFCTVAAVANAQSADLEPIAVQGHYDNAVGSSEAASQGQIHSELLKSRPALRPGELLEFVPGLIVAQHSGDGKANQYFLRGFNLDHGTDFATSVNGIPINMPTHGHGQGYTDLNFLIPELVDRIDYRKGPYFARDGDFASAGAAASSTAASWRSTLRRSPWATTATHARSWVDHRHWPASRPCWAWSKPLATMAPGPCPNGCAS